MPLTTFFISSFRDICVCAGFSGQNKFSPVTIFKECLRLVLDLVQILYSIALQCVFPVLLFNPHTSGLVWMKTDYNVHVSGVLSQPASFPSSAQAGLLCLAASCRGLRGPASPPNSMPLALGKAAPCSHSILGAWVLGILLLTFSTWI